MASAIVNKIVEKGIDNVDLSMLSPKMRTSILSEAAELLINKGDHDDAVKAVMKSEDKAKAYEIGKWLEDRHFFRHATLCYIASGNRDKIEEMAGICVSNRLYITARFCYDSIGDLDMMKFIEDNFPHTDS